MSSNAVRKGLTVSREGVGTVVRERRKFPGSGARICGPGFRIPASVAGFKAQGLGFKV